MEGGGFEPPVPRAISVRLRGSDAHATARFAHRAFENIPHTQFAIDLLHVNRLALVGEGRIAGYHEEPADAAERRNDFLDHLPVTIAALFAP